MAVKWQELICGFDVGLDAFRRL